MAFLVFSTFFVLMIFIILCSSFVSFNKKRKEQFARGAGKYNAMMIKNSIDEKEWWQIYSRIRHYSIVPFYYGAIELGISRHCPLDPDLVQAFVDMAETMSEKISVPRTKRHLNAIMRAYARHGIVPTDVAKETEIIPVS